jgi:hypothetical protein
MNDVEKMTGANMSLYGDSSGLSATNNPSPDAMDLSGRKTFKRNGHEFIILSLKIKIVWYLKVGTYVARSSHTIYFYIGILFG